MASEKHCTPAQLALAWLLAQGNDIVPIPGSRHRARVEENAGAAGITLTPADLDALNAIAPRGVARGLALSEGGMRLVNG
jgi:aryl-alcohol dehydrogenase-like predicted oxidoreductase